MANTATDIYEVKSLCEKTINLCNKIISFNNEERRRRRKHWKHIATRMYNKLPFYKRFFSRLPNKIKNPDEVLMILDEFRYDNYFKDKRYFPVKKLSPENFKCNNTLKYAIELNSLCNKGILFKEDYIDITIEDSNMINEMIKFIKEYGK